MEHRRPGLIGPLILITIGILLLLANMGMLPLAFWEIAIRFWPLLLILIGLDVIFGRRSALGALAILVLWVALIGGMIWLASNQDGRFAFANAPVTDPISQPLGDIKSASIDLQTGFSNCQVSALNSDSADLVKGTYGHGEGTHAVKTYSVTGSEARLGLREEGNGFVFPGVSASRWDLGLYPQVPMALRVNGGVGRTNLDLSALNVTTLAIDTGIGTLDVTTPKTGVVTMRINGGIGSATVNIPQGVAASIRTNAGLAGIQVDPTRFPKSGGTYQSPDYAGAANKISIDVDGGIGSISIR